MKKIFGFKKWLSVLFAVLIFISAFLALFNTNKAIVNAEETLKESGIDEEQLSVTELFEFEKGQDGYYISKYKGQQRHIDIPQYYNGEKVVGIKDCQSESSGVFEDNKNIYSVNMGENCINIGGRAFYGCSNLEKVYFSDNTAFIGRKAFYGCSSFCDISLPDTVTTYGFLAFYNSGWWELQKEKFYEEGSSSTAETYCLYLGKALIHIAYVVNETVDNIKEDTIVIGEYAFTGFEEEEKFRKTTIVIPASVKYINSFNLGMDEYYSQKSVNTIEFKGDSNDIVFGERSFYENSTNIGNNGSSGKVKFGFTANGLHYVGEQVTYYNFNLKEKTVIDDTFKIIAEGAFKNCNVLTEITIPSSVKRIGKNAFLNCENLKKVIYEGSGLIIEENAFKNCKNLTDFTGIKNVKTIKASCFENCKSLSIVELNNCVVGAEAFKNCTVLGVSISGECSFEKNVFYGCNNVKNKIGDYYFSFTENQTELVINSDKVYICDEAFCNSKITKIDITANEIYFGSGAFKNCKELTSVTLNKAIHIPDFCFYGAEKLETLNFSPTSVGEFALSGTNITNINCTEIKKLDKFSLSGSKISEIDLSNIAENGICAGAFYNAEKLEQISGNSDYYKIENGILYSKDKKTLICYPSLKSDEISLTDVATIADYAFANVNLNDAELVLNVTSIGKNAFYGFKAKSVTIASDNVVIQEKAFYNAKIKSFSYGEQNKSLTGKAEYKAFAYSDIQVFSCAELQLESLVFKGCSQLTDVCFSFGTNFSTIGYLFGCDYFNSSVKTIQYFSDSSERTYYISGIKKAEVCGDVLPYGAFMRVESLENVEFGDKIKKINKLAFASCTALTKVVIPENITTIQEQAFTNCSLLESVTFCGDVSLKKGSFAYCENLKKVTFRGDALFENGVFSACPNLKTVVLAKKLTASKNGYGYLFANATTVEVNGEILSQEKINDLKSINVITEEKGLTIKEIGCLVIVAIGVIVLILGIIIPKKRTKEKHKHHKHIR